MSKNGHFSTFFDQGYISNDYTMTFYENGDDDPYGHLWFEPSIGRGANREDASLG
jgi:hypothetical protein